MVTINYSGVEAVPNLADAEREVLQVASSHGGTGGSCTPRGGYVPCAQQCAELSGDYSEHMGDDESGEEDMPMLEEEEEEEEEKVSNDSDMPIHDLLKAKEIRPKKKPDKQASDQSCAWPLASQVANPPAHPKARAAAAQAPAAAEASGVDAVQVPASLASSIAAQVSQLSMPMRVDHKPTLNAAIEAQLENGAEVHASASLAMNGKPLNKLKEDLEMCLKLRSVKARSAIYQKAMRAAAVKGSEDHKQYSACKTPAEKNEWRVAFAQKTYDMIIQDSTQETSYQDVDITLGEYLPARKIWEKEGLDQEGFEAAANYIIKCCRLKGKWVSWNSMTERWEFLYMRRQKQQRFVEAWTEYIRSYNCATGQAALTGAPQLAALAYPQMAALANSPAQPQVQALPAQVVPDAAPAVPDPAPAVQARGGRGGKTKTPLCKAKTQSGRGGSTGRGGRAKINSGRGGRGGKSSNPAKSPSAAAGFKDLAKKFQKMKEVMLQIRLAAQTLVSEIKECDDDDNSWNWAKNNQNQAKLEEALKDLIDQSHDKVYLITTPFGHLKKMYSEERLATEFGNFLKLNAPLKHLEMVVDQLMQRKGGNAPAKRSRRT